MITFVTFRITENVKESPPNTVVHCEDIYQCYEQYCMKHEINPPAARTTIGQALFKTFEHIKNVSKKRHKVRTQFYQNVALVTAGDFDKTHIDVPDFVSYCNDSNDGEKPCITVTVPKDLVRDKEPVFVEFKIDCETHALGMEVCGAHIDTAKYGLSPVCEVTQRSIDSFILIARNMKLCKGIVDVPDYDSKVQVLHTWNTIIGSEQDEEARCHSRRCTTVLPYLTPHKSDTCKNCTNDLKQLQQRCKKRQLDEHSQGTSANPSCSIKESTDCGTQTSVEDNKEFLLGMLDHQDLVDIIRKVIPANPGFADLLAAQLKNATSPDKDNRYRRWTPSMISLCLNLWAKSPNVYRDLKDSELLVLPSERLLQYHKNKVRQHTGINIDNIKWMYAEGQRRQLQTDNLEGGLLLDEVSIQKDLQVVKRGKVWELIGAVDLGELGNSLDTIDNKKDRVELASHCLQYLYCGFGGFRWPVAYFATGNASPHVIYSTFWDLVKLLREFEFKVNYVMLDGSAMNRSFTSLMFRSSPRSESFTTGNIFAMDKQMVVIQDIKHCLKKIRNNVYSSGKGETKTRCLTLNGLEICWDHFVKAYRFNISAPLRIYRKLSRDHVYLSQTLKMRNHLAEEVLNYEMLGLMKKYQATLSDPDSLNSTIAFLEQTAVLVEIFTDTSKRIESLYDTIVQQVTNVLDFFHQWETQYISGTEVRKHLMSRETRQDLSSSLMGFMKLVQITSAKNITLNPGLLNSDLIENWFCQIRSSRLGANDNCSLAEYGPANNTNLICGSVISSKTKNNCGPVTKKFKGVMPPAFLKLN